MRQANGLGRMGIQKHPLADRNGSAEGRPFGKLDGPDRARDTKEDSMRKRLQVRPQLDPVGAFLVGGPGAAAFVAVTKVLMPHAARRCPARSESAGPADQDWCDRAGR